jgi:hypothetical protein
MVQANLIDILASIRPVVALSRCSPAPGKAGVKPFRSDRASDQGEDTGGIQLNDRKISHTFLAPEDIVPGHNLFTG